MQSLYDSIFVGLPQTKEYNALNSNFDQIGFSSQYFIYNLGSIMLAFLAIPL